MNNIRSDSYNVDLEWHDTPQLWVAYRGCGCAECPKGFGKTKDEAIADLDGSAYRSTATPGLQAN